MRGAFLRYYADIYIIGMTRAAHDIGEEPATAAKIGVPKTRSPGPNRDTEGLGAIEPTLSGSLSMSQRAAIAAHMILCVVGP